MIVKIKSILRQSTCVIIALYIFRNAITHIKTLFKNFNSDGGATHRTFSLDESIKYITNVFNDYKKVSGKQKFYGKVAELGPGDCDGVALLFLNDGARHIDLVDRFYSLRDTAQQKQILDCLIDRHPKLSGLCPNLSKYCIRHYGKIADKGRFFDKQKEYDFIVSRAVLEHVDAPEIIIKKMYGALSKGGYLIHKIDLRDHGMYPPEKSPLKFLEIPNFLYRLMTYGSGFPNRFLFHRYKTLLLSLSCKVKFFCTGLYGVEPFQEIYEIENIPQDLKKQAITFVDKNKCHFSNEFKKVSSEDLMISSFFFVCEK
ncbi:MAG: class I SAM-dependent methyltransferase [Holosporales bacterium]|jgi:SAM-dependent methyltransferase|nr:class I SAM-dependent methyltransferase [Holosporales bacterium]